MKYVLILLAAVFLALIIQNFVLPHNASVTTSSETSYDRVIRTNTLRCAYAVYPPFLGKDPNTGKLNGIGYEVMEAVGQVSGLTIEWGPEIDWGNITATLQSGKADAFCSGMYLTPKRGKAIAGSLPIYYSVVEAFARPDDKKFDNNADRINKSDVRISVNMGDVSEEVAQRLFPLAQRVYKGATGGEAELFLNVATNKADLALSGPSNLSTFNQANPASALRKIPFDHPLMSFQAVIGFDIHNILLQQAINASLYGLISGGTVDRILRSNLGKDYGVAYFPPKL